MDCDGCRKTWAMYHEKPKCHKCLPPLMRENRGIYEVFRRMGDQHIMGTRGQAAGGGMSIMSIPIALDISMSFPIMDRVGITGGPDQLFCLDMLRRAHSATIKAIR